MSENNNKFINCLLNLITHPKTNFVLTGIIGFLALYVFFASIFGQNLLHPLQIEEAIENTGNSSKFALNSTFPELESNNNISLAEAISNITLGNATKGSHQLPVNRTPKFYIASFFSLFIIWVLALSLGFVFKCFFLPPLLGHMFIGILFTNLPFLHNILVIVPEWDDLLRRMAFIFILVRCAFGLNYDTLRKSFLICGSLGLISSTFEALLIVLVAHFLYQMPLGVAIVYGFVLASTSPAVTVPTMIRFQRDEVGTNKGIPTVILASAAIDNIYCITAFTAISSVIFTSKSVSLTYTITRIPLELLVAVVVGLIAGVIMRSFPRNDSPSVHFTRASMATFVPLAFYFGCRSINADIAGPIVVIVVSIVLAMRWKRDNPSRTKPEENGFRILWNLFFQPFLFVLIGFMLDFSDFTWPLITKTLIILGIGVVGRILIIFFISLWTNLNCKERVFVSFTFTPKATVQAALAPILYKFCLRDLPQGSECTNLILQSCIIAILLTAPIGQLVIFLLGKVLLKKRTAVIIDQLSTKIEPFKKLENGDYHGGNRESFLELSPPKHHEFNNRHQIKLELRENSLRKRPQEISKPVSAISFTKPPNVQTESNDIDKNKYPPLKFEHESYDEFKERMLKEGRSAENNNVSVVNVKL